MNTTQLYQRLYLLEKSACTYGVIPCDLLDDLGIGHWRIYLIINSKPSSHDGQHWLAIYQFNSSSPMVSLDSYSFGIEEYGESFSKFTRRWASNLIEGKRRL